MRFQVKRARIDLRNDSRFENSIRRIIEEVTETSGAYPIFGINGHGCKLIINRTVGLHEAVLAKVLADTIREIAHKIHQDVFDVDILIPDSFIPYTDVEVDCRRCLEGTKELAKDLYELFLKLETPEDIIKDCVIVK